MGALLFLDGGLRWICSGSYDARDRGDDQQDLRPEKSGFFNGFVPRGSYHLLCLELAPGTFPLPETAPRVVIVGVHLLVDPPRGRALAPDD